MNNPDEVTVCVIVSILWMNIKHIFAHSFTMAMDIINYTQRLTFVFVGMAQNSFKIKQYFRHYTKLKKKHLNELIFTFSQLF